jgi:hypothetical protein
MVKPPTSEPEHINMINMIIQPLPVNRAFFRTNISKNLAHSESAESNLKTVEVVK